MADDLDELKARIVWSWLEINSLEESVDAFISSGAYRIHHEVDPETGDGTFFMTLVKPIPTSFAIKTGSILHELRATLDSLACALAVRNGRTAKQVYFAICEDAADFDKRGIRDKLKKLSLADQATIASLKPWRDGNPLLHALHAADLTRKHHRLLTVNTKTGHLGVMGDTNAFFVFLKTNVEVTSTPAAYMRIRKGGYVNLNIGVDVLMREPGIVAGKPVAPVLRDFAALTKSIIERFD